MSRYKSAAGWVVPFLGALGLLENLGPPAAGREPSNVRSVTQMNFGKTPDGTAGRALRAEAGKLTVKVMTYGAIDHRDRCPRPQRQTRRRRPRIR